MTTPKDSKKSKRSCELHVESEKRTAEDYLDDDETYSEHKFLVNPKKWFVDYLIRKHKRRG